MNKQCYRIVFNRCRGQVMAVAECAAANGAGGAGRSRARRSSWMRGFRPVAWAAALLCGIGGLLASPAALAQIVADPAAAGQQRATVLTAPNGVPLVNIQTPSNAGISRNRYSQFDVQQNGAVLNNSRGNVQTQLGGWVQGNPWLASGGARLIVNEVNSSAPSQLLGHVEVAGPKADVVIANPSGLYVNGAGFINAGSVTLSTGLPRYGADGSLAGFQVRQGGITVDGAGLDASNTDYARLLARAVQVNAGVWAPQIQLVAGSNDVSADPVVAPQATAAEAATAPRFALDVSALGGMYAGKITLIGTEAGVGVRNAGTLGADGTANGGGLTLSSAGWLDNSGTFTAPRLDLSAQALANSGKLAQTGSQDLLIQAAQLSNVGVDARIGSPPPVAVALPATSPEPGTPGTPQPPAADAGQPAAATVPTPVEVLAPGRISAGQLLNTGLVLANGATDLATTRSLANSGQLQLRTLDAAGSVDNSLGRLQVQRWLGQQGEIANQGGSLSSSAPLNLQAQRLDNTGGQIASAGDLSIELSAGLDNTQGLISGNALALNTQGQTLNNDGGQLIATTGALSVVAGQLSNAGGLLQAATELDLRTRSVSGAQGRYVAGDTLALSAQRTADGNPAKLDLDGADLQARQLVLASGDAISTRSARLSATDVLQLHARQLDNAAGVLTAPVLELDVDVLSNVQGQIVQTGAAELAITPAQSFDNTGGTLATGGRLTLDTPFLINQGGTIFSQASLQLSAGQVSNDGGTLASATGAVNASVAQVLTNSRGRIYAQQDVTLVVGSLAGNAQGRIASDARLTVLGDGVLDTRQGLLQSGGDLELGAATLSVDQGAVLAGQALRVTAATVDVGAGALASATASGAPDPLTISARSVSVGSGGSIASGGTLDISATALGNAGSIGTGAVGAPADVLLEATQLVNTGLLQSTGALVLSGLNSGTGLSLTNQAGQIVAGADLSIRAGSVAQDQAALIQAGGKLMLAIDAGLSNAGQSSLVAQQDLTLAAVAVSNTQGSIVSGGVLNATATSLDNRGGQLASRTGAVTVELAGDLDNRTGVIAGARIQIQAAALDNQAGNIGASGGALELAVDGNLANAGGRIVGVGPVTLHAARLDNQGGTVASTTDGLQVMTPGQLVNDAGSLLAATTLSVGSASLSNQASGGAAGVIRAGDVGIATGALNNSGGVIAATGASTEAHTLGNGQLAISAGALDNHGAGLLQASADFTLQADSLDNSSTVGSGVVAGGRLNARVDAGIQNQAGYIGAGGGLALSAGQALANSGGTILNLGSSTGAALLSAARVDNSGGSIGSHGALALSATGLVGNASGRIVTDAALTLAVDTLQNTAGTIDANDALLSARQIDNSGGAITAGHDLGISATEALQNAGGLLQAAASLTLTAPSLANDGGRLIANRQLSVATQSRRLSGSLSSGGDLALNISGDTTNDATLTAGHALTLTAANITNNGTVHAGQDLTVTTPGALVNTGELSAGGNTTLTAQSITNSGPSAIIDAATGTTTLTAGTVSNSASAYGNDVLVRASTSLVNDGAASLMARRDMLLAAPRIDNTGGALIYADGNLTVGDSAAAEGQPQALNNIASRIEAGGNITFDGVAIKNLNVGLQTGTTTRSETVDQTLVQSTYGPVPDLCSTAWCDSSLLGFAKQSFWSDQRWHDHRAEGWVADSTRYPVATFGANFDETDATAVAGDDPIWAKYGVAQGDAAALADALRAFNLDLLSRATHNWIERHVTQQEVTETTITDPGQAGEILAGGTIALNKGTSVLNDSSRIVAGGALVGDPGAITNVGAQGSRTVSQQGDERTGATTFGGGGANVGIGYGSWGAYTEAPFTTTITLASYQVLTNASQAVSRTVGGAGAAAGGAQAGMAAGAGTTLQSTQDPGQSAQAGAPASAQANGGTRSPGQLGAGSRADPDTRPVIVVQPLGGDKAAGVVVTTAPSVRLQANSVFNVHAAPGSHYLIETDPRFANYRNFLSSDYLLTQLGVDPATAQRRLGDGYYEQRLIGDQILALSGQRYLAGYADTEREYQALMAAGVTFAQTWHLTPGVSLTPEQMAALTTDIVWLTTQTVTLADGSTQQVLVPQVYLRHLDQADVQPTGALIAARDIGLKSTGDIVNDNAAIQSAGLLKLQAANELRNQGGQLRGRDVLLDAGRDLNNLGGSIQAQGDGSNNGVLIAKAGRDLLLQSTTQTSTNAYGTRTNVDRVATVQGGDVSLAAARDLLAQGAQIGANGSGARLVASAGGALKVTAVQTSSSASATLGSAEGGVHNAGNYVQYSTQAQVGSNLHSDGSATLVAGQQLELTASDLSAAGRIALAGASVNIQAGVNSQTRDAQVITRSGYSQLATTTQTLTGGSVQAGTGLSIIATGKDASGDITLQGANVGTATGTAVLSATRDVSITSLATTDTLQSARQDTSSGLLSSKTTTTQASRSATTQNGSNVNGQTVLIVAGDAKTQTGDITIAGSSITSQGLTQLHAGRDLNITSVEQSSGDASSSQTVKQSSGLAKTLGAAALISSSGLSVMESAALMGRSGAQGQAQHSATQAVGSTISAGSLITDSGLDTTVQASTVVADSDIVMHAGRDMNIAPGTNTQTEQTSASNRKTGAIGEVWQPAVGTVRQSSDGQQTATTHTGSQIASLGGNVSLSADNHYTQTGSNVLAPQGDVDIAAQRVLIDAATDTSQGREHSSYSKTALGGSVSAPLLSAAQGARQSVQAGSKTGDTRLQALAAVTAGLQAKGALDAGQALAGGNLGGIKVSASIGSTKSDTTTEQTASTAVGSRVAAGGNVSIRATGAGADSTLDVIGSDISAGGKTRLKADGAVSLLAAQDSSEQQSKNSASSASLGIGYAMGGAQNGFTLDVSASKGRGHADGTDITQVNTHVSGQQVDIQSGGDTNLRGAVVTANQVTGQIGGNLNVQSLQDTSSYKAKQESAGFSASICVPPFCAGASTVSASVSQAKAAGNYAAVQEQSGIKAGDGGFQLNVKGNTELKGGVIESSQAAVDAGKNSFSTASITATDIQNRDDYKASSLALSVSTSTDARNKDGSPMLDKQGQPIKGGTNIAPGIGQASGSQGSTTQSGISGGVIALVDGGSAPANLNRSVSIDSDTNTALTKNWNGAALLNEVQAQSQVTQAALPKIANEIGTVMGNKVLELRTLAKTEADPDKQQALLAEAAKYDEGGAYRIAAHTALGALGGGTAGALGAATSASAAPAIAQQVDQLALPEPVRQALIAATDTVVGSIAGGTAGAVTGGNQVVNNYLDHRRPDPSQMRLSEKERYEAAVTACAQGSQDACTTRDGLALVSLQRDQQLQQACSGSTPDQCNNLAHQAAVMGNVVQGAVGSLVYANSPETGFIRFLNTSVIEPITPLDSFHAQVSQSTAEALQLIGGDELAVKPLLGLALKGVGATKTAIGDFFASQGASVSDATLQRIANNFGRDGDSFTIVAEEMAAAKSTGWKTPDGKIWWPPGDGAVPGSELGATLQVGQRLDRYGGTTRNSTFLAPIDTSLGQRALSPATDVAVHDVYEVLKPIPLPPSLDFLRLGQRMYFVSKPGMVTIQARPKVSADGRLYSGRVRRAAKACVRITWGEPFRKMGRAFHFSRGSQGHLNEASLKPAAAQAAPLAP